MNEDIFLVFFYKIINENYLVEKTKISYILKDNFISLKDTKIIEKKIEKVVVEIELENNKILLIEDLSYNFITSYGILVGDGCEIVEFQIKFKENNYICEKKLFEKIKTKIDYIDGSLRVISFKELYNKKFEINFKKPKLILEIEDYIKEIKKLDMNKIHIIKSNFVGNFVPCVKKEHFKLAQTMDLPLVELIKSNFIKNSTINIYDNSAIKKIINPMLYYEEVENVVSYNKNDIFLFKDIEKNYYFETNRFYEEIIQIFNIVKIVNFNKEKILKEIGNLNSIKLSNYYGEVPLPIWRCVEENKYLKISNKEDFKKISGVELKLDQNLFGEVYLQTLSGNKVIYKNKFLRKELISTIENLDLNFNNNNNIYSNNINIISKNINNNNNKIIFENITDLVLQLIFYKDKITENTIILEKNKINSNNISMFVNGIEWILSQVLETITQENKKVFFKSEISTKKENYYFNLGYQIRQTYTNYLNYPDKDILLKESLKCTISMKKVIQNYSLNFEETYFIIRNLTYLIENLKEFDNDSSLDFEERIKVFFDIQSIEETNELKESRETIENKEKANINLDIIKLFSDLNLTNDISRKNSKKNKSYKNDKSDKDDDTILVFIKDKNLEKKYFNPNINFIDLEPNCQEFVKPNIKKIKEIFKYSAFEVIKEIKKIARNNLKADGNIEINLKNKKATLKKEFFNIHKKYLKYKTIVDNKYFLAIVEE